MPGSRRNDPDTTTIVDSESQTRLPGDVLLVVGEGHIRAVPFVSGTLTIGRAADCDVVVDHPKFSRRHAQVMREPELSVKDLGSTNGTRIDGASRRGGSAFPLRPGDAFYIGPFSFVVTASTGKTGSSGRGVAERLTVDDPSEESVAPLIREIAASGVNVLIQGETGVGKDVLATTLHALSRRTGPMMRINCAALSESLLEAELFGHEKGAFTGALARKEGLLEASAGGTVFLDEIGELPLGVQAKLLHAIEEREILRLGSTRPVAIDVRFIAATNRDLPGEVKAGRFRSDLFFRIEGVTLHIPPLRERRAQVVPLALRFLHDAAARLGRGVRSIAPEALVTLEAAEWPGNVRELKAVIERGILLATGSEIGIRHLAFTRHTADGTDAPPMAPAPAATEPGEPAGLDFLSPEQREDRERVLAALDECVGNQTRAAKLLGISRTTLVTKLALYRIPRPRT